MNEAPDFVICDLLVETLMCQSTSGRLASPDSACEEFVDFSSLHPVAAVKTRGPLSCNFIVKEMFDIVFCRIKSLQTVSMIANHLLASHHVHQANKCGASVFNLG